MLNAISQLFKGAPAVGLQGIFQFVFSPGSAVWAEVNDEVSVRPGKNEHADVVIEASERCFMDIMSGVGNVEELFANGKIKITGNLGLATLLPQVIEHARHGQGQASQQKSAGMNARYPAPPRMSDVLSATQPRLQSIERRPRHELSIEEFQRSYVKNGIPLILTGALNDWPLYKMGREESIKHFAELQGITRHGDYVEKTFSTERDFRSISMQEFIASLDKPVTDNGTPPAYMGNNIVPEQLMELICLPPYFEKSLYIPPRIWIGPKGTLTPLHRDDTDNLFAQVWGQKSFILAAPHHRPVLGTWSTSPQGGLEGCQFNPDKPDYENYPQAKEVTFIEIIIQEGEMLFLPEGWFHHVRSISTSLSVNFWVNSGRW